MEFASYGDAPWDFAANQMMVSPAKTDPYFGHAILPDDFVPGKYQVRLEMNGLKPETAARVSVNGTYAGGFLSEPLRLDVTNHLQPGKNTFTIEPFSPEMIQLVFYPNN